MRICDKKVLAGVALQQNKDITWKSWKSWKSSLMIKTYNHNIPSTDLLAGAAQS